MQEIRQKALEGRTEREQLEMKAYFALSDLSDYFKAREDPLQYEVNRVMWGLDKLRNIPEFPRAKQ